MTFTAWELLFFGVGFLVGLGLGWLWGSNVELDGEDWDEGP